MIHPIKKKTTNQDPPTKALAPDSVLNRLRKNNPGTAITKINQPKLPSWKKQKPQTYRMTSANGSTATITPGTRNPNHNSMTDDQKIKAAVNSRN